MMTMMVMMMTMMVMLMMTTSMIITIIIMMNNLAFSWLSDLPYKTMCLVTLAILFPPVISLFILAK